MCKQPLCSVEKAQRASAIISFSVGFWRAGARSSKMPSEAMAARSLGPVLAPTRQCGSRRCLLAHLFCWSCAAAKRKETLDDHWVPCSGQHPSPPIDGIPPARKDAVQAGGQVEEVPARGLAFLPEANGLSDVPLGSSRPVRQGQRGRLQAHSFCAERGHLVLQVGQVSHFACAMPEGDPGLHQEPVEVFVGSLISRNGAAPGSGQATRRPRITAPSELPCSQRRAT